MITIQKAKLRTVQTLSERVKEFTLEVGGAPFNFIPGQFLTIHFQMNGKSFKRSYSLSQAPQPTGQLEFATAYVEGGVGSEYLFALKPGDELDISGPYGRLVLNDVALRFCLVGTGTGMTPYRAMLPQLSLKLQQNPSLRVVILAGYRTRQERLYHDDFLKFAKAFPQQVDYQTCLSREASIQDEMYERLGHVQTQFSRLNLAPKSDLVYLCGNPQMIDESYGQLLHEGFDSKQIIREKYISNKS